MCPAVCWGKSENYVRSPSSRGMAGLEVADGLEAKLGPVVFALSRYGREYEPEVVARIYAVNDLANKPPGTFGEHDGASNWPRLPPAKRELVDVVTCLFTEKPSQTDVGSPKRVEDYQVGCGRDVERPVELRDANVPTRRTDAALCGEAHEAAGAAVIARDCKHVHRVVQMGDKTMVRFLVLAVQSAPNRSTSHGRHLSWRASSSTLRPSRHRLSLSVCGCGQCLCFSVYGPVRSQVFWLGIPPVPSKFEISDVPVCQQLDSTLSVVKVSSNAADVQQRWRGLGQ